MYENFRQADILTGDKTTKKIKGKVIIEFSRVLPLEEKGGAIEKGHMVASKVVTMTGTFQPEWRVNG